MISHDRLMASLRARLTAVISSLDWVARRLFSMMAWKLGTPMASRMAAMLMVTISSISVNPLGSLLWFFMATVIAAGRGETQGLLDKRPARADKWRTGVRTGGANDGWTLHQALQTWPLVHPESYRFCDYLTRDSCSTKFVFMKNVTITLDEETARWARIEAAKSGTSVSRLVGEILRERRVQETERQTALVRFMERPVTALKAAGEPYPTREALYDRSVLR